MTKRNQPTKVVLTMRRKDIRKRKGIRYAEYYNMVEIQDELYRQGMMKKKFYHLMPIIASPQNIRLAYRNLKNNKGSNTPGVDGKTFADYAKLEDVELIRKVQEKLLNYQPKAVRRVYIPKSNGKLRPLGIPTVLDRLVQQSILQVLEPVCESKFHRYSYGFRPNRSCKQAVAMCYKLAQVNGYHYVVDVDIKGFFDHVNHGKLLKQLWSLGIRDKSLLCVISRMLKAPVEENGKRTIPQEGTPQGGVLSPLLANIVLNELDWWIHSQWAGIPIHNPSPSEIWRTGPDGMLYRPGGNTKLQRCNLKHVLFELGNRMSPLQSVEYCDNRLARFVASKGKCEITGKLLSVNEVHCHHFLPRHLGGTDQYSNLRIVHVDVHRLIHATTPESIQFYLRKTGCYKKPCLDKINRWRASANLPAITL